MMKIGRVKMREKGVFGRSLNLIEKYLFGRSLNRFGKVLGAVLLLIGMIFTGEWVYAEIRFHIWLGQNEYRLDFSSYKTPEAVKGALLKKLPIGSPSEEVQAFRMAYGYEYVDLNKRDNPDLWLQRSQQGRGLFGLRALLFGGIWLITFELDSTNYYLKDIQVVSHPGP